MVNKKLEVGEQYLSVVLMGSLKVAAFANKQKSKPTDPDYLGNGIAVWISKKKAPKEDYDIKPVSTPPQYGQGATIAAGLTPQI